MTEPDPINLVSIRAAARMLGISERTCRRWVADGVLRSLRLGGRRLFDVRDLEAAIAQAKEEADRGITRSAKACR